MDAFLKNIASYLYRKYGNALSDSALVFPNRRAGLFFTRYLSEIIDRPVWLPAVVNISDLMQSASSLQPADPITLNFELYRVYRSVTGSRESFDEFYNWGEILLADFDEIDKYMADAVALFRNVTELKKLEEQFDYLTPEQVEAIKSFWKSFSHADKSPQQKEFLRIWETLAEIYVKFKELLAGRGIAYEGMIFRDVALAVEKEALPALPYQKIFVAGFNALTECEKRLFDYLRKMDKAEFFWDYDEHYTARQGHQAGFFMRDNLSRYPHTGFSQEISNIKKSSPSAEIISVPSNSGQAKLLGTLGGIFKGDDPAATAIILPDESLLLPVLSSLPGEVTDINVTMGYPLRDGPVYGFVLNLISLQKNCRTDETGNLLFHHKDVLALSQHPCFIKASPRFSRKLAIDINEKNLVCIDSSYLNGSVFGGLVFRWAREDLAFLDYIGEILTYIAKTSVNNAVRAGDGGKDTKRGDDAAGASGIENADRATAVGGRETEDADDNAGSDGFPEREFIYRLLNGLRRLSDILENSETEIRFDTLVKLMKKVLHGIRIPFNGEPLGGVQVMGVLETRALDFENVVWLSMNEGVFPAMQTGSSFIPFSLRRGHGLPGNEQHEAVWAYYFYRMLQRARRTIIVYNTRSEGLFTGEMSRFIYQLKFDRQFHVSEKSLVSNLLPPDNKPVRIEKTPDIMRMMERFSGNAEGSRYLSPGAINAFADCSLRFYFRYIARIPEPGQIVEEIDMAIFGNIMHKSAQLIYEPFAGNLVSAEDIGSLLADGEMIEQNVIKAFSEVMPGGANRENDGLTGMNKIISGVIITYIREMLERDIHLAPFTIVALEKEYRASLTVYSENRELTLNLGGIIDRVDEVSGTLRVVDYKTGGDEPDFKTVESLFERGNSKRRKAVFQTFLYAWLYLENSDRLTPVSPVLYQIKKFFGREQLVIFEKPSRSLKKPVNDFAVYREEFENRLRMLLADMFNSQTPFDQVDDHEVCKYCVYNKLCKR